ncbi:MAG: hypothetical protein KDA89_08965 [Planctomycetaceae bacterium]|nr:hypothetical protein [Planctomycetaceae bacterium]
MLFLIRPPSDLSDATRRGLSNIPLNFDLLFTAACLLSTPCLGWPALLSLVLYFGLRLSPAQSTGDRSRSSGCGGSSGRCR